MRYCPEWDLQVSEFGAFSNSKMNVAIVIRNGKIVWKHVPHVAEF